MTTEGRRTALPSLREKKDSDLAPASLRRSEDELEKLRLRLELVESRLRLIENSAGWQAVVRYRQWLRRTIWAMPRVARIYEGIVGFVLRGLTGGRRASGNGKEIRNAGVLEEAISNSEVIVCCDRPLESETVFEAGVLQVEGWAVSRSGIQSVQASIDASSPVEIRCGLPQVEVGALLSEYPDAERSGFAAALPVDGLSSGVHQLNIKVFGREGETARAHRLFRLDGRDPYQAWIAEQEASRRPGIPASCRYLPLISIVTPVYKTPLLHLRRAVDSVRQQTYARWELCLVDDGSGVRELSETLRRLSSEDDRVRIRTLEKNSGIAAATNAAIEMAGGEYVAFLDHDDQLAPFALEEVAKALNCEERPDVLYSDEDKITDSGARFQPFFKPGFSIDLLRAMNYVCHFLVVRRELLAEAGGLREGFEGSQDHDLALRLSERTSRFHRVPQVLYHWRADAGSTALAPGVKPDTSAASLRALREHFSRRGVDADVEETGANNYHVRYELDEEPAVLIVMPTGGNLPRLTEAVGSVLTKTRYRNFRLAIADNSSGPQVAERLHAMPDDSRLSRLDYCGRPFNFSALCNDAARSGSEPLILFLNDDIEVINPEWLRAMVEPAIQDGVGAVGARLLFPDGTIQHAGVTLGVFGAAGHAFRGLPAGERHYFGLADVMRDCSAVTGACLMTRREVFEALGGFDELELPVAFQDIDYCLRALDRGLRVVYTPYAELYHFESASKEARHRISNPREVALLHERWGGLIEDDPFYNPNLTRREENFGLRIDG